MVVETETAVARPAGAVDGGGDPEADRRSWSWKRESSGESPGETESSGSVSSRCSDDQEARMTSPNDAQSPEVSSNVADREDNDTVRKLTEKLSAALLNIRAKEDLVKQHAKVAEEAVLGWEKADAEVATLKQQLETAAQKNSSLEERISQLDDALKRCVRQLRQSREEQEQKAHDALVKKTHEWESDKFELETQLVELETQLEAAKEEEAASASVSHDLQTKLEALVKENSALKAELLTRSEELDVRTLERELSTQAAETASKQHLESIKKVNKLEAECRRLRAMARRTSSNDHKPNANSVYVESLTDSQSDSGERLLALDNEPSCSDSWASALIAELDQFKTEKTIGRNPSASAEIDLMDDFLEIERLAALSEANHGGSCIEPQVDSFQATSRKSPSKSEVESMLQRTTELEEKIERMEIEKADMEMVLTETRDRLEMTCNQLKEAEETLMVLRREIGLANSSKQVVEIATAAAEAKRKVLESQLVAADSEVRELREKVVVLEGKVEQERVLSAGLSTKCQSLEDELAKEKQEAELQRAAVSNGELKIKREEELASAAGKLAECQKTIASLGQQLRSLAKLEDFMFEVGKSEVSGGLPVPRSGETSRLQLDNSPESASGSTGLLNGKHSSPSLSSSSFYPEFAKSLS